MARNMAPGSALLLGSYNPRPQWWYAIVVTDLECVLNGLPQWRLLTGKGPTFTIDYYAVLDLIERIVHESPLISHAAIVAIDRAPATPISAPTPDENFEVSVAHVVTWESVCLPDRPVWIAATGPMLDQIKKHYQFQPQLPLADMIEDGR